MFYTSKEDVFGGGDVLKAFFYTHDTCTLCEEAEGLLSMLSSIYDLTIVERNIYTNDAWLEQYALSVPVIEIAEKQFMYPDLTFESIASFIEEKRKDI